MGLFGRSRSCENEKQIQELISQLNRCLLRAQDSLLNNHGISDSNIVEMRNICEQMKSIQDRMQILLDGLSNIKMATIYVPWTDGRYYSLPMWMEYYNTCGTVIKNAMSEYYAGNL